MELFSCRLECARTDLKLEDMKWEKYLKSNNRGACKACDSKYEAKRQAIKKAEKNPADYMTCNGCDRVFTKHTAGQPRKDGTKTFRTCCPFCTSPDIEEY